jgi:diguanylate cyclase (GGDEF)-like protein
VIARRADPVPGLTKRTHLRNLDRNRFIRRECSSPKPHTPTDYGEMTHRQTGGKGLTPASAAVPTWVDHQVTRLGEALEARVGDVREQVVSRSLAAGQVLERSPSEQFERICTISTIAVARWMEGGDPRAGLETGREAWEIFGQLAAHREAPLNEVTKRCLRWRDAVDGVLRESATATGVSAEALLKAQSMVAITLDVTLVRMCEVFETERRRTEEELARREEELAFMATHDQLTGLPNRTLILDRGTQMLGRSRRRKIPVAALLVNLDNFKAVNDSLGHTAGDQLLQAIAARLDGILRDTDALGRVGSDEFVVLAEELTVGDGAQLIAERLQEALKAPFNLDDSGEAVRITASIGVVAGERGSAEELLRDADIAMHRAKWDGKDRYVVFESGMQDLVQSKLELEADLRKALERDEFFLVYQPTFDLHDMSPTGVEALIRWKHADRGIVQPNDFIPLLEETGLIVEVGKWVLEQACRQGAIWRAAGHQIAMAVNVSGRQLDRDELVSDVSEAISQSGLAANALTLEITETTLMANTEETARRLQAIKQLGVRIAIDDFGTGYSSLAHLQRFPVDALKIDRSFISQLTENPEGKTLIHTLVQLGQALSIETLAEGIERQQELSLLQEEHCQSGQGFLFARPMEADAADAFLRNWLKDPAPVPG